MTEEKKRLTEEEIDEKIRQAKELIKKHSSKAIKIMYGGKPDYIIDRYRAKNEKTARRKKVQKASKKANRKKK